MARGARAGSGGGAVRGSRTRGPRKPREGVVIAKGELDYDPDTEAWIIRMWHRMGVSVADLARMGHTSQEQVQRVVGVLG